MPASVVPLLCQDLDIISTASLEKVIIRTPADGDTVEYPDNIMAVRSAEYGDGLIWRDVKATVQTYGLAMTEESLGQRPIPGHTLKLIYVRNDTGGMQNYVKAGLNFFLKRDLHRDGLYGCDVPETDPKGPYVFATSCQCPTGQHCKPRMFHYYHEGKEWATHMGECGCCAASTTLLVIFIPIVVFVVMVGWCKVCVTKCSSRVLGGRDGAAKRYKKIKMSPCAIAVSPPMSNGTSPRSPNPLDLDADMFSSSSLSVPPMSLSRRDHTPPPIQQLQ